VGFVLVSIKGTENRLAGQFCFMNETILKSRREWLFATPFSFYTQSI